MFLGNIVIADEIEGFAYCCEFVYATRAFLEYTSRLSKFHVQRPGKPVSKKRENICELVETLLPGGWVALLFRAEKLAFPGLTQYNKQMQTPHLTYQVPTR